MSDGLDASISTYNPAQTRVAAVFDVDRTLVARTTTERIFIRYLISKRVLTPIHVARTGLFVLRRLRQSSPFDTLRSNRVFLAGIKETKAKELAQRIFASHIQPHIGTQALAAVRQHQEAGHAIVLLSGSLDFLLEPLRDYLKADYLISTHLQVNKQGRFSGAIEGLHPYGEHKATLLKGLAAKEGFDLSQSYAYADHYSDVHILELFGHPVAVNPHPRLREYALAHDWEIMLFPAGEPT